MYVLVDIIIYIYIYIFIYLFNVIDVYICIEYRLYINI
jgi:hypothetical protein